MDGAETLSIAKVKVEYYDPSGIFPLISGQLENRLPLRNLHWKSPSRPLRSIESLHVELTKASGDVNPSGGSDTPSGELAPATKERRHQMPGLRETPYLKLYLLRCDDSDSYKTTYRKTVRDWLKTHTPASQSSSKKNSQENHDAYEWMILHVILPNTNAAKEPLSSAVSNKSETSGTDSKSSKFLNRGSGTLLEKLKADFNVSGKNAPDRVAQIRLSNEDLQNSQNPPKQLTRVSTATQEQMEAWDDVISKYKALILASFSLRVGQYEEDIREKDSQRSLPGWNFCTFFVLKEGLAQGFERVGLLDDTLAGYEELSIDLDNLLSNKHQAGPMDSFLPHTEELKQLYENAENKTLTETLSWSNGNRPISSTRKPFRELILANNVSVYDFKVYVLARKLEILNRMSHMGQGTEDLVPLAQMCQLGSSEIPSLSRVVREDILQLIPDSPSDEAKAVIDNIVDSWTFAAAQQFLDETNSTYLSQSSPKESSVSTLLRDKSSPYPTRKSSLTPQTPQEKDDAQSLFDKLRGRLGSTDTTQSKSGKDYLAMQRAQLVLLQRRILEILAVKHGYSIGWAEARKKLSGPAKMSDVSLSEEEEEEETNQSESPAGNIDATLDGIYQHTLASALTSKSHILRAYEKLTISALDLFFTAGHGKSFERMLADLAVLKFQLGDYAAASNFFAKVIPIYSHLHWGLIETEMLLMHAKSLKVLNRKDDYVRMLLGLLAKAISIKTSGKPQTTLDDYDIEQCAIDTNPILPELLSYSAQLPYEVTVEMATYFTNIFIEPHIRHHEDKEGFQVKAKFRCHFEHQFTIDKAKLLLISSDGSSREVHLENHDGFKTKKGTIHVTLNSSITTFGLFKVQRFTLVANKIAFIHDFNIEEEVETPHAQSGQQEPRILCYPSADSFEVQLSTSRTIQIDQVRYLEITCLNGLNDLETAEMKLKPLISGLRLRIADAKVTFGDTKINAKASQGTITISKFDARSKLRILIPYELEDSHHEVSIRIDVSSSKPSLDYSTTQAVIADLPLDVNVHDLFKPKHIFSRFHVRTATEFPIRILDIHLEKTDAFIVEPSLEPSMPTIVYSRQPSTFMYKIRPTQSNGKFSTRKPADQEKPLKLVVGYQCLDEVIKAAILSKFSFNLVESEFLPFKRFLIKILQERLNAILQPFQFNEFAMLEEISVPSYEEIGWDALTADLPNPISDSLCQWLKEWHENCNVLQLPDSEQRQDFQIRDISFSPRKIIISVPLPRVHVLYSAKLTIQSPFPDPVPVGHALPTTLSLKHARHWDSAPNGTHLNGMEFMYDVDAPPDTWLIGGQRRGRFFAEEGEVKDWTIVLIPLKTGKLLLPSVDVRPVGKDMEGIACETEISSLGKNVLVVGDLQRTTIAMSGTEAFIVAADRRV